MSSSLSGEEVPPDKNAHLRRSLVQAGMIAFGVLLLALNLFTATESVSALRLAADAVTRRRLELDVAAKLLRGLGFLGLFVSQAVVFQDLQTYFAPFTPPPGLPRGFRANRRLQHQIAGRHSYSPSEIPLLRATARRLLAVRAPLVSNLSLMVLFLGIALSPVDVTDRGPAADPTLFSQSFRILGIVMVVILAASALASRRAHGQAEAFLNHTAQLD